MARLSFRLVLIVAVGLSFVAAVISFAQDQSKAKGATEPREVAIKADDDELNKLLKQRYNEVVLELKYRQALYETGRGGIKSVQEVASRLLEAGGEVFDKPEEKAELLTRHLELMKQIETDAEARFAAAEGNAADVSNARYHRIDAEIKVLRNKSK